jgi:tetratricopeptide (TPR) repeat protein
MFNLFLCMIVLALSGCKKDPASLDAREEKNPLIQQGQAYMETRHYAKAEDSFKQAIAEDPCMARPYLELALIYHQYQPNYIQAICCYNHYLQLRPNSEKAPFIKEQIRKVQQQLVNAILNQSGAERALQKNAYLQKENNRLTTENARLKQQIAQLSNPLPAPSTPPKKQVVTSAPPPSSSGESTKQQIYTVVAGDNLTKIAKKFYGTPNYTLIYEANKDRMKNPGDLRVGQTLVIPACPKK